MASTMRFELTRGQSLTACHCIPQRCCALKTLFESCSVLRVYSRKCATYNSFVRGNPKPCNHWKQSLYSRSLRRTIRSSAASHETLHASATVPIEPDRSTKRCCCCCCCCCMGVNNSSVRNTLATCSRVLVYTRVCTAYIVPVHD